MTSGGLQIEAACDHGGLQIEAACDHGGLQIEAACAIRRTPDRGCL